MAWHQRFCNVFRPGRLQRDLERELSFHVTERVEELQERGLTQAEAARIARLQFGNFTRQVERTRDMDINGCVDSMARNLRYAVRSLVKTPTFTLTVVLILALGIGANSAVFSAVYAVLLRPLPFPDGNRLLKLAQLNPKDPQQPFVAPTRLEDWNRLNSTLQAITGYYPQDDSEFSGELPDKVRHAFVAPRFLQVWGVAPALGRDFTPEEERFDGPGAVLISDHFWRRRFGTDPHALGKVLRFGQLSLSIIGVMPPSFALPDHDVDLWSPSPTDSPYAQERAETWFIVFGRLKPGVTLEQARADLARVQSNLGRQFPKTDAKLSVLIEPLKEAAVRGVRSSLWILFGSVSLLLLIACTNIAALLLSKAAVRQHEIAVRFSLGASRLSVAGQLLAEVLIVALAGAVVGLLAAAAASHVFRYLARDLPRLDEIGLDWRIVLYALVCALVATLLCGVFPAIRATRRDLALSLGLAARTLVSNRKPLQLVLVGMQIALAVTLLAGAGLLVRSFQALARVSPGFDPEHVLTFHISTSWAETNNYKVANQRMDRLLEGLRAVPGVELAATAGWLPGVPNGYQIEVKTLEGRAETEPKMLAQFRAVTPDYFAALRIPLLTGEMCRERSNPNDVMVNRSFANSYLGGAGALRRHLAQPANSFIPPAVIVGIVGDARETGFDREPVPTAYWCFGSMQPGAYFLLRTHGDPKAIAETIRRKVHEIEPRRSVYDLTPLAEHISDAYALNRMRTIILAFFALTAIGLACVGLYGTLSYMVSVRQREVGLRIALGAMRRQIAQQFVTQALRVCFAGVAVGLVLAAAFTRLLTNMLYGVSPRDAATLTGVATMVFGVSVAASLLPALRAARLEPMKVLRDE
jgi:putative ABC transport system permease protein